MSETNNSECQLKIEPFFQCCCNCNYLKSVNFHCCRLPKPTDEQRMGDENKCVCGISKGFACCPPESDAIFDNWPEHSCGCELYNPKDKGKDKGIEGDR